MDKIKQYGVGAVIALVVALGVSYSLRTEVSGVDVDAIVDSVKETLKLGATPGDISFNPESERNGLRTFHAKQVWGPRGTVCQIPGPSASSTLVHLGAFGKSASNSAGNLRVFVATTTINLSAASGGNATSTNNEILRFAVADTVPLQVVATSTLYDDVGGSILGFKSPFIPPNSVFIFDLSSATSSIGNNHLGKSTCEVQTVLQF